MAVAEAKIKLSLLDNVTSGIRRLQARLAGLTNSLGLNRITGQFSNVGKSIAGMSSSASIAMGRLSGLTSAMGLGGGGVLAGGILATQRVSDLAKEIRNLSAVAGLAPSQFQRMAYAARTVGVEQDKLADILKDVNDKIGDYFQTGAGPMADFFEQIAPKVGITKNAFRGLNSSQALQLYYNSLRRANVSTAEMTFYMEALASDLTLIAPLLEDNGAAMNLLGAEAAKTGNILGDDVIGYASKYDSVMMALTGRLSGLANMIGVHLMPVVVELTGKFNEWFDVNAMLVRSTIADWALTVSDALRAAVNPASDFRVAVRDIVDTVSGFVDAAWPVVDFLGGPMQTALIGLAAYILGPMTIALTILTGSILKLGLVILTTPIGWLLGGLALLAGGVYLIYTEWDAFVGYWEGVWTRIVGAFDSGWGSIGAALLEFWPGTHVIRAMDYVVEYLTGFSLLDAGRSILTSLTDGFVAGFWSLDEWLAGREDAIVNYFSGIDLSGVGMAIVDSLKAGLESAWASVTTWFDSAMSRLTSGLPASLRASLGVDVATPRLPAVDPGAIGAVPVGPTIAAPKVDVPTIEAPTIHLQEVVVPSVKAPTFSTVGSVPVGPTAHMPASSERLAAETVQAGTVEAGAFNAPEPLLVHKPQAIDASTHVGAINIHGVQTDNLAAIRAAVDGALRDNTRRATEAARSQLAD